MKKTSKTIVFFGNERLATGVSTTTPIIRRLVKEGFVVAAVIVNNENNKSRKPRELEIKTFATLHTIPVLSPKKITDVAEILQNLDADVGVLAAYGKIVPQKIIDIFPTGIVNIHPSLLPLHRGPTPIESVILEGAASTGVSLMKLAKEMDAGPIYAHAQHPLTGTETKQELADSLAEIGSVMLADALPGILAGDIVAMPQLHSTSTYDSLIEKNDGILDFTKPAAQLEREIRGYAGWPGSRTILAGKDVVITKAHVGMGSRLVGSVFIHQKQLCIGTVKNILIVDTLKPFGKANMTAQAFLNGHSDKF
ncbi:MAG: methionyl-tRNA formyltransferase [Candidatus Saccharimonadales bacterium]